MKARSKGNPATAAAVAFCLVLAWGLRATAAPASDACPIPLHKGTRWIYGGKVEWTTSGSAKVKRARIQWVTEVLESFKGSNVQAAVVQGFPDELAWYEPGRVPGYSVLLAVSNRMYHLKADGENQAKALARQLSDHSLTRPPHGEELFEWPLAVGRKCGQDPSRDDAWYCWHVEHVETKPIPVKGFVSDRSPETYRLAYRTNPDHQLLDIAPGLGIVRYVFRHHGTVASAELRLLALSSPRDVGTRRKPQQHVSATRAPGNPYMGSVGTTARVHSRILAESCAH